jgi:hypothetical protein
MKIRTSLALWLALLTPQWSGACSLAGLANESTFTGKQEKLSADQVRSITAWYVDLRDGRFGVADVSVFAAAIEGDPAHARLVESRVHAVAELLKTLIGSEAVPFDTRVSRRSAAVVQQFPEVVVSVQPKCAATNSCGCAQPVRN